MRITVLTVERMSVERMLVEGILVERTVGVHRLDIQCWFVFNRS
jgi:hypothetical protein